MVCPKNNCVANYPSPAGNTGCTLFKSVENSFSYSSEYKEAYRRIEREEYRTIYSPVKLYFQAY